MQRVLAVLGALFAIALGGCLPDVKASGNVAADARVFAYNAKYPGQSRGDGVSLVAEPQFDLKSEDGVHAATLRPFYRLDPNDESAQQNLERMLRQPLPPPHKGVPQPGGGERFGHKGSGARSAGRGY